VLLDVQRAAATAAAEGVGFVMAFAKGAGSFRHFVVCISVDEGVS